MYLNLLCSHAILILCQGRESVTYKLNEVIWSAIMFNTKLSLCKYQGVCLV